MHLVKLHFSSTFPIISSFFTSDFPTISLYPLKSQPSAQQKVSNGAKIRNRFNQIPYMTQDTNGKVTNSQLDTTNESQEVSPFPAGDHKHI